MLLPPFRMRIVSCSLLSRLPTVDRLGPRVPPSPAILWQYSQPLAKNNCDPAYTGPLFAPTVCADNACAVKFGDHVACSPAIHRVPIIITASSTTPAAHGRLSTCRSPLLATS